MDGVIKRGNINVSASGDGFYFFQTVATLLPAGTMFFSMPHLTQ